MKKLIKILPVLFPILLTSCNKDSKNPTFNGYEVINEESSFKFDFDTKETKTFENFKNFESDIDEFLLGYNFYTIFFNYENNLNTKDLYSISFNYNKNEENYYESYLNINFALFHNEFKEDISSELSKKDEIYGYLKFDCKFLISKQEDYLASYTIKYIKPSNEKYDKLQVVLYGSYSCLGYIDLSYHCDSDFKRIELLKNYLDFNLIHHYVEK